MPDGVLNARSLRNSEAVNPKFAPTFLPPDLPALEAREREVSGIGIRSLDQIGTTVCLTMALFRVEELAGRPDALLRL